MLQSTRGCTNRLQNPGLFTKLRWCFWHANVKKAKEKLKQILLWCSIVVPETPRFQDSLDTLDYRVRDFFSSCSGSCTDIA